MVFWLMRRAIVHLDADAFFASVEQAADPRLRGKPVAVGGEKRGIIASASYEARRFGIWTPMPSSRARRLCPKLILLPGDFEKYERFSRWMFSYAYDFTPEVEIGSIDEGYFDVSGARQPALSIAHTIRDAIRQALKLTVSEGIGSNKLVSQIASKLDKPAAFRHVPSGQETRFLHPLSNRWLPGVGPKTGQRLDAAGLVRVRQIAQTPLDWLEVLVGRTAGALRNFSHGIDERPVVAASAPAKSYSHQQTFGADQTDEQYVEAVLRHHADRLMATVRAEEKSIRTLTVKIRYNDLAEEQCSESLTEPTDLETDIYGRLRALLRRAWQRRVSLRMVSLKFSNIYDSWMGAELPLEEQDMRHEARRRLAVAVDELRRTRGPRVVVRGHDFVLSREEEDEAKTGTAGLRSIGPGAEAVREKAGAAAPVLKEEIAPYRLAVGGNRGAASKRMTSPAAPGAGATRVPTYVPLRLHSYYSFLDSTLPVEAMVGLAKEMGLPAVALTDQGNLHGAVEFAQVAKAAGIKPIFGVEIQGRPLRLYVQNATGYRNLCRILSGGTAREEPSKTGWRPARSARQGLLDAPGMGSQRAEDFEGLLAVSPDPEWARLFPGRFYLEMADPGVWRRTARPPDLPCVAALPVHYARPGDHWKYEVVQSIRTRTLLRQEHPDKASGPFHFRTPREMLAWCDGHPELLARTVELAERCEFELPLGPPQFPDFKPLDGSTPREFLRKLVRRGMARRYPAGGKQVAAQVDEELAIIAEVGYEEYFLVVWDILQDCRRAGIEWITRGSAADSLVCYCLEISDVCPIRFDLYFRRFLNRERMQLNKLPDIDVDFAHDRKDDVVDLVFAKYGPAHAAVVGGFSTYLARSALGDVAKVLGVSEYQIRRVTEHLPRGGAADLPAALAESQECRDLPMQDEPYRTALRMAAFLDGFPRHPKMHPCGVVLSRQPMMELTPCFVSHKNYPTTHFDMDAVEAIGLVKIDILAQGGLAAMRDVKEMLRGRSEDVERAARRDGRGLTAGDLASNRGSGSTSKIKSTSRARMVDSKGGEEEKASVRAVRRAGWDLRVLEPWEDPEVWEMIASGGARAVHHIESPAMIGLCRMCNVRDIDTLIAVVSVIRPGAANENKKVEFTRRYQGLAPVTYPHPSLEPCLRSTFGLVVYEEHLLQICEAFAGLPPGRADVLRRALSKGKHAVIAQIGREFAESARARGRTDEQIVEVWKLVSGFEGYAFCKAHSTAYGVEAYQAAWLKRNFPAEFLAAVLTNGKGFYRPIVYVLESHRLGIPLTPPSINAPGPAFQPQYGATPAIRVPAVAVKGLSEKTRDRIIDEREGGRFGSVADFFRRVRPRAEEMEALLRAGAFDEFGRTRTAQFWEFQWVFCSQAPEAGQEWLLPPAGAARPISVPLTEPSRRQRLQWEAEAFGYPVSAHPLALHEDIAWETYCPVNRLGDHVGEEVVTCGLVIEDRLFHQVTGEPMKFLTLADWTGMIETELFAKTYRSYGLATVRYPVLEVTGHVEPFENGRGYSLRVMRAGKPRVRLKQGG